MNLTTNNMSCHIEPVAVVTMQYWQGVPDIYNQSAASTRHVPRQSPNKINHVAAANRTEMEAPDLD